MLLVTGCANTPGPDPATSPGAARVDAQGHADPLPADAGSQRGSAHDRAFFEALKRTDKIPEGTSAAELLGEIEPWLASPDPALRDTLTLTLCARWIRGGLLSDEELHAALARFSRNLEKGVGETGTDGVLLRSFSALALDAIVARDLERPFLSEADLHELVTTALAFLSNEKDLRGFDAKLGWMHATAHTADLLRRLSREPALCEADQEAIVVGLEAKLGAVDFVFTHGENRRLAQVLVALMARADFQVAPLEAWIGRVRARNDALWNADVLDEALYARVENETQLFRELLAATVAMPPDNVNGARVREVLLSTR